MEHNVEGEFAQGRGSTSVAVRLSLVVLILATLGMIGAKVWSYPALMRFAGAKSILAEVVLLLAAYGVVMTLPNSRSAVLRRPRYATALGLAGGGLQILHLLIERFVSLPKPWDGVTTLLFMLGTFFPWGYAGYMARRRGATLAGALASAIWCACVSMVLAVTAGTLVEYVLAPIPLIEMRAWAEFGRSGWSDVRAFSIANTLDEASTHLLIGPVIAIVFGLAGSGLGGLRRSANVRSDLRI